MDRMRQVIAKISRFIIHQTLKELLIATLDDNSSCSTDGYLSCSSNVVVESNEQPLITTTHDSHVISVQTLDDNSSCSTDGVAELKELLIATLDDNSCCSTDDYLSCSSNVVVESNEQPLITTNHDSHVISIQTLDDNSSCSTDVVAELKELLIATTYHDSHAISKKFGIPPILPFPPTIVDGIRHYCSNHTILELVELIVAITVEKVGIPPFLPFPPTAGDGTRHYCSNHTILEELVELILAAIVEKIGFPPFLPFPPTAGDGIMHYCSNHTILLVGEGDFSFSACLAKAFGSADNMVATSLNSLGFLEKNYPSAKTNIGYLRNRGGTVLHKVDATNMEFNILVNEYIYDRIIFNFPLAGFFNESRRQDLKRNRKLVRSFMENAKNLLASGGEIHITHKTSATYRKWGIEDLAKQCRLKLIEEVEFKLRHYPGYHSKYGFGGNDDFNCYPSKTYKFGLK